MDDPAAGAGWGERTEADVAGLLVELGRVCKAAAYYGPDAPTTRTLADRAARAWQSDLARAGPLELEVDEDGFHVDGLPGTLGSEFLASVAAGLTRGAVQRIRFTEVLSRDSMLAFACALSHPDELRPDSQLGIEIDGEVCWMLGSEPDLASPDATTREMVLSPNALGSALLGRRSAAPAPPASDPSDADTRVDLDDVGPGVTDAESNPDEKPDPAYQPLAAPAADADALRLVVMLQELDRCGEDEAYVRLARRVAETARSLSDEGREQEANRAMLVLADHSVGEGGRSGVQARVARATLLELAGGARLGELIDRACSRDTAASVRAAQVLLNLGGHAVPALLERLDAEDDSDRSGQLTGLLIALGETAVPALAAAMSSGTGRRARLAIQIAGDMQCPSLVGPLRDLLCARQRTLQREAARALVEMGNSASLRALVEALESRNDRAAEIAAFSLGTLAAPRSLPALIRRLERATDERRWGLVREILQALAQFHEGDRATARALLAWLQRGGPPWRRPDLDLKLEAVTTLGQLGGEHTTRALREIAGLRLAPRICERARRILDRRGDGRLTPR